MADRETYTRINIYLDDPTLRTSVKIASAKRGVSMSAYCLEAIKRQLDLDQGAIGEPPVQAGEARLKASRALEELRTSIGPIGVAASALVAEGRSR